MKLGDALAKLSNEVILICALAGIVTASPVQMSARASKTTSTSADAYPFEGLCRRWDHRTAIVHDKLYLLGGRTLVQNDLKTFTGFGGMMSNEFISLDLTKTFTVGNALFNASKNEFPPWEPVEYSISASSKYHPTIASEFETARADPNVPITREDAEKMYFLGGTLWTVDKTLVLIDGVIAYDNKSDPSTLWTFDIESGEWDLKSTYNVDKGKEWPMKYDRGGDAAIPPGVDNVEPRGFRVGGARVWDGGEEKHRSYYFPAEEQMLEMNLKDERWDKNAKALNNNEKSVGAAVVWIPVGDQGSLVMLGGTKETKARVQSGGADDKPDVVAGLVAPSEEIRIYDIAKGQWYSQTATSARPENEEDIPFNRMDACAVAVSSEDSSQHFIYYYAGGSGSGMFSTPQDSASYGDLFILALPAFRWYRAVEEQKSDLLPYRRTRHKCHRVGKKMIVIGGTTNDTAITAENPIFPSFTRDSCAYDEIHVLDMETLQWEGEWKGMAAAGIDKVVESPYSPNDKAPEKGWSSKDLEELFAKKTSKSQDVKDGTGTNDNIKEETSRTSTRTIVLAVVIPIVFVLAIVAALFKFCQCAMPLRLKEKTSHESSQTQRSEGSSTTTTTQEEDKMDDRASTMSNSALSEAAAAGRRRTQMIAAELDSHTVNELDGSEPSVSAVSSPRQSQRYSGATSTRYTVSRPGTPSIGNVTRTGSGYYSPMVGPIYEFRKYIERC